MGRPSTIGTHPKRAQIENEITQGYPLTEISARYGVSVQALSRYAKYRKAQLAAELDDDGLSVSSLLQRLTDVADAARDARRSATFATPAARSRALEAEARVLAQVADRIGVDDSTVSEHLIAWSKFARIVAQLAPVHREHAAELIAALRAEADEDLSSLADALAARL